MLPRHMMRPSSRSNGPLEMIRAGARIFVFCITVTILNFGNICGAAETAPQAEGTLQILVLPFSPLHPDADNPASSSEGLYGRQFAAELAEKLGRLKETKGHFLLLTAKNPGNQNERGFLVMGEPIQDPASIVPLAEKFSAQYVVEGFSAAQDGVALRLWIFDVVQRRIVAEEAFRFPPTEEAVGAAGIVALRLLQVLGISVSESGQQALRQVPTRSWDAYQYYLAGEDNEAAVKSGIALAGRESPLEPYINAVRIDPKFTLAAEQALSLALEMTPPQSTSTAQMILPMLTELEQLRPDFWKIPATVGYCLNNMAKDAEAIETFQRTLRLKPDFADGYYRIGKIYETHKRVREAQGQYRVALQYDENHSEASISLGAILANAGQLDEAIRLWQKALETSPENPVALYNLGKAYEIKGNQIEARQYYERAAKAAPNDTVGRPGGPEQTWKGERIGRFWLAAVIGYVVLLAILFLAGCVLSLLQGRWVARASERILTANDRTTAERRLTHWYAFTILAAVGLFYLSLPFMVAGMLWGGGYLLYAMVVEAGEIRLRAILFILIAAIGGTWAILMGLFARPRVNPLEQSLSEQDQPKLFEVLQEIAQATGTPMVDEVRVAPDSGIGVHMEGRAIAALLGRATRVLTIGVATLHALTALELKAILAHEYGHFSNRDTDYNGILFQVELSLAYTLHGMASLGRYGWLNPVFWLLKLYRMIYVLITRGFGRTRELFADRVAAVTYGPKVFSSALEKVAVYGICFEQHVYQEVAALLKEQKAFQNIYQTFEEGWNKLEPAVQDQMRQVALTRRPHWTDSHPPVQDRVVRLQRLPAGSVDGGEPASSIFHGFPALQESMSARFTQYVAALTRRR